MILSETAQNLSQLLHEINLLSITVRLLMALVLGGILGAERGLKNHPAGFMTYVLVCIGSTLIMLTNQYTVELYPGSEPTRLAAQVVSGIGFLGAGTIIVTKKDEVRGLTTAAGIWLAAGLGIAIGVGFYTGAFVCFLVSGFALCSLKKVDIYIKQHAKSMEIYLEYNQSFSIRQLSDYARENEYELLNLQRSNIQTLHKELGVLTFTINFFSKVDHDQVIESLYRIEGVEFLRELA